ncbi:MAG: prolyl oligopeptidase family serine peptidase [Bacteroidota bacterium]
MNQKLAIITLLAFFTSCEPPKDQETEALKYPVTNKVDTVDNYFGVSVADPYRWLEDDLSPETADWVKQQNAVTFGYLENIDFRERIKERLEVLFDYERVSAPFEEGDYEYFYQNDGLQNQSVLYRRNEDAEAEVFLDPNEFSDDGTVSLSGSSFTRDGSLFGYLISIGGSDWRKLLVMDTETKTIVEDTLHNVKFSGLSWKGNEGFYYSSYDRPKNGSELSAKTQIHKLYYHKLGTKQADDQLIFGGEENPYRYVGGGVTEDQRFLVISASVSTSGNKLFIKDLANDGEIQPIDEDIDTDTYVLTTEGDRILLATNLDAPKMRVVQTSIADPTVETWKDVIPETENVLSPSTGGGFIFGSYLVDAKTEIRQFTTTGKLVRDVTLPAIGTAYGVSGDKEKDYLYYTFTSFANPQTIYKYDITSGGSELYKQPKIDFDPEDYITKQVFYESKDGTKVPMFIVHKKGLELDGTNPTELYAYGGFNVSLRPSFSTSRIVWLENGGIYAQPNIRGGGEYGEDWHKAGTKMQKQNVFDDFIAAGEWLIENQYTSSEFLSIRGGSNGGLLVGATMAQRPDLAKVAFPAVGVMDMLRYHNFTAGAGWASDYGTSADSKEMFEYLKAYSPVHALKEGTEYPATMVTTADHDDRVVPAHSFKFAATLQEKHVGNNPVLIRIETDAGHGAGTPISKTIDQVADRYAFAWYNMGVIPPLAQADM